MAVDFSRIDDGHADGEDQMVFHYSREERLKHAPEIVQSYYNGTFMPKRGLFRSLVQTRGNRYLLISLGFCIGVVLLASVLLRREAASISGLGVQLTAFSFDEQVYASLHVDKAGKDSQLSLPSPLVAHFTFINTDGEIADEKKVVGKYDGSELFLRTTSRDYDILKVQATVAFENSTAELTATVQKR